MKKGRHRATFDLTASIVDDLEDAWLTLRKEAPVGKRKQVSKSGIVRVAIELACADLKKQGIKSRLARKLLA